MKAPLILAVGLVAFAANATDAARFAALVGVAALDVVVLGWAIGVAMPDGPRPRDARRSAPVRRGAGRCEGQVTALEFETRRLRSTGELLKLLDRLARLEELGRQAEALRAHGYCQAQIAPACLPDSPAQVDMFGGRR